MSDYQNQSKSVEKSAKNINEAIEAALEELGASRLDVDVKIISEGAKGFLGLGAKDAVVRVTMKEQPKPAEPEPEASAKDDAEGYNLTKPSEEPRKQRSGGNRNRRRRGRSKQRAERTERPAGVAKPVVPTEFATPSPDDDPVTAVRTFLTSVFAAMGLEVSAEVALEDDIMTVNLEGDNMGIVIGKRGDTLDSLQYLTSLVANRRAEDYIKVTIDTENYREKRSEALIALSDRLAEKVARTGKKFTLEPMNPYERRIIHANLQDHAEVSTFSVGSEPYRKVVIAPKNAKRFDNKRGAKGPARPAAKTEKSESSYSALTYKADFKPTPHKAEYHSYEEYLAAQRGEIIPPPASADDEI